MMADNFDLRKYLAENKLTTNSKLVNEQADHVSPMVVKAYKEYLQAKKDGGGEKEYHYYSKKLNNTYSTRADRDAIEAILKKKYGSALEEQDIKRDITDVKRGDIIVHDETGKRYEVLDFVPKAHRLQSNKLTVVDTEGNRRVINPYKYSIQNESLKKKSEMNEIKGFEEFKETGFKLGDKVEFMGSAHPTHTEPIELTGKIEYNEPADEIGVRVDGYGKFIPFSEIQSNIELIN